MNSPAKNFVIRHLVGAKANQVEEFDFNGHKEITLGRSSESDVQFDPEIDTVVSREHGKIVKDASDSLSFSLIDNNSRNGIFINKTRVRGSAPLFPGDEIQLGNNGPAFVFDIDPRPAEMMPQTRLVEIVKPTSEFVPVEVSAAPQKNGIGKQTFERVINYERKKSQRTLWSGLAAALVIFGTLGFVAWKQSEQKSEEDKAEITTKIANVSNALNTSLVEQQKEAKVEMAKITQAIENGKPIPVSTIVEANKDKVVKIYISWELYELTDNEEIIHEYTQDKQGNFRPLYVQTQEGIEPYLTTKKRSILGLPISGQGTGTGFVATADGQILTNRHVGAAWMTSFTGFQNVAGFLVKGFDKKGKMVLSETPEVSPDYVRGWVPSEATMVNMQRATVQGRNKYLKVVFANSSQTYEARLITPSQKHDVSLIKVDVTGLAPVNMLDNYNEVKAGEEIIVMGYPGGAPQPRIVRKSNDPFKPRTEVFEVATPVTSPGHIQQLIQSSTEFTSERTTFGDSYQVDLNATGGGNSGGPMFDAKGNVIGIYYAGGGNVNQGIISYAVPIKYGLELLKGGK